LCHGDSGSGFVEILDGRAQLVGITSNIDSSSGDDCIAANKQAELVDVFAYRGWITGKMGMSPEQADGRVRLRWSGVASQPGIMSLQCLTSGSTVPSRRGGDGRAGQRDRDGQLRRRARLLPDAGREPEPERLQQAHHRAERDADRRRRRCPSSRRSPSTRATRAARSCPTTARSTT
jgi:hypothetical protein